MRYLILGITLGLLSPAILADDIPSRVNKSRILSKTFMQSLKTELQQAMESGGPVNAIDVCHKKAPEIAARLSRENGIRVARTSLKLRNPDNRPDRWERAMLKEFNKRKAQGHDPMTIEAYEVVQQDDKKLFRYMKAIPTGDLCLSCHGKQIDPAVSVKLEQLYPKDKATGYDKGQIRGAFSITQEM